ncbi:MAG: hypothetical protein R3E91_05875 [Chlamydiales bacterium]
MSLKNTLTNETLNRKFNSPFSLVNYAISFAKMRIEKGEGIESNLANDVIELIGASKDQLLELDSEKSKIVKE